MKIFQGWNIINKTKSTQLQSIILISTILLIKNVLHVHPVSKHFFNRSLDCCIIRLQFVQFVCKLDCIIESYEVILSTCLIGTFIICIIGFLWRIENIRIIVIFFRTISIRIIIIILLFYLVFIRIFDVRLGMLIID